MDLTSAGDLYVFESGLGKWVLAPDPSGTVTLIRPQPLLLRVAYVGLDVEQKSIQIARGDLARDVPGMFFAVFSSPDGPPYRSGCIFTGFMRGVAPPWSDGSNITHGTPMNRYLAVTPRGQHSWLDGPRIGRYGYFLTGEAGNDSLWKLFRVETDSQGRSFFTLTPIRVTSTMPQADFSSLGNPMARKEATDQYEELCRSIVGHNYRDVVTKARNIVELVMSDRLGVPSQQLYPSLQEVRSRIDKDRVTAGFSDLEYHLAHKIRLVHGQTHATQSVTLGRQLTPEFALTVAEDLAELLRVWGYCAG